MSAVVLQLEPLAVDKETAAAMNRKGTPSMIDPIIKRGELPKILGVHTDTVRKWLKDKRLPEYDVKLSLRTCGWKASTLRAAGIDL